MVALNQLGAVLLAVAAVAQAKAPYCLPGQACFPSTAVLASFNASIGGKLTVPPPYGSVCYTGTYDAEACEALVENKTDWRFRQTLPAAMMFTNNEFDESGHGCEVPATAPIAPVAGECVLGGLAKYIVEAESADDISLSIKFAAQYNLRLRVKNSGHDYYGRSTGPGAFTIRTAKLKSTQLIPSFTPVGSSKKVDVFAFGSGVTGIEAYEAADAAGVLVAGGYDPSVGVTGGYLLGGGISPFTPDIGFAVDNVVQFDIVTIQGQIKSVSASQDRDLFWALRGGGAGFAVVTRVYTKAHAAPSAVTVVLGQLIANDTATYKTMISTYLQSTPQLRANFTSGLSEVASLSLVVCFIKKFDTGDTIIPASESLALFNSLTSIPGVTPAIQSVQFPTWLEAYNNAVLVVTEPGNRVGVDLVLNSRIVSEEKLATTESRQALADFYTSLPSALPIIMWFFGGSGATKAVATCATAINPAWRTAAGYMAIPVFDASTGAVTAAQNSTRTSISAALDSAIGTAVYVNEDNKYDDNFQERFWGSNYARLAAIKTTVDPNGVFSNSRSVLSEVFGT